MADRLEIIVERAPRQKRTTCRHAVLAAFVRLEKQTGESCFELNEIVNEVRAVSKRYPPSTIRTYVASLLCANAPINHRVRYPDLERVGPGLYRRRGAARPLREQLLGLDLSFHMALVRLCDRCEQPLRFYPRILRALVFRVGGAAAARQWVATKATEEELNQLWAVRCLGESVEALMLHAEFHPLFNEAELRAAWRRLEARGFDTQRRIPVGLSEPRAFLPWSSIGYPDH